MLVDISILWIALLLPHILQDPQVVEPQVEPTTTAEPPDPQMEQAEPLVERGAATVEPQVAPQDPQVEPPAAEPPAAEPHMQAEPAAEPQVEPAAETQAAVAQPRVEPVEPLAAEPHLQAEPQDHSVPRCHHHCHRRYRGSSLRRPAAVGGIHILQLHLQRLTRAMPGCHNRIRPVSAATASAEPQAQPQVELPQVDRVSLTAGQQPQVERQMRPPAAKARLQTEQLPAASVSAEPQMQMDPQVDPAGAASVKVEPAVEPQVTELRPDQTATAEPQLLQVESPQLEPAGPAPQVEPAPEPQTQSEPVGPLDANVAIQTATACA